VKLPEDPSPVPAGMSDILVIFDMRNPNVDHSHRLTNDRVLDILYSVDHFHLRVLDDHLFLETSHVK